MSLPNARGRILVGLATLVLIGLTVVPTLTAVAGDATARTAIAGPRPATSTVGQSLDFNGDGYGDLAIGVPFESVDGAEFAGGVNVLYGSASGLTGTGSQFWSQDSAGIVGSAEFGDEFGAVVAGGDFNHDGYADLAIGVPDEALSATGQGGINVIYGTATGLTSTGNQFWSEDSVGVAGTPSDDDSFGAALAVRDFNRDGFADLAVGVPGATKNDVALSGAVAILEGSLSGLSATGSQRFDSPTTGIEFGTSLAAGNLNGKAGPDLAIGARTAKTSGQPSGGAFWLLGNANGLSALTRIPSKQHQADANCGEAVAVGNFHTDAKSIADLLIGCPQATKTDNLAGLVDLHVGSDAGPANTTATIGQAPPQLNAWFGTSLAAADFVTSGSPAGTDEFAVGVPQADVSTASEAGAVTIDSSSQQLQVWTQGSPGIVGTPEDDDRFGSSLASGDFNGDGFADLAIGVPNETVGSADTAGGINVLYGSATGLVAAGNQFFSQDTAGVVGTAQDGDTFGQSLAARDG